ncbi:MAG: hypothetical protein AAFP82_17155, partial [Bacteroidota bacterium]
MDIFFYIKHYIVCFTLVLLSIGQTVASNGKYPIQNFRPTDYKAGIQNIDFAQNRNMNLFVANNLGVLVYDGSSWEVHEFKKGKKYRSLAFDEESKRLYVGSQGTFGFFEKNWNYVSLIEQIPTAFRDFDEVWDVFILNQKVYFCTFQAIYVFDGTSISVLEQESDFDKSFASNGKLFTQNKQGELFEIKDQRLVAIPIQNESQRIIASVLPQQDGHLVFYNSGEIEMSTSFGTTAEYDDLSSVLKDKYINHVLALSDSRLAISTQTAGVFLYDLQRKNLENITKEDGLESNACLRTFQDYSGNLWVGMQNGIALVDINSPLRFINQDINLQGSGYDAFEAKEGTYYTTSNGIYFLAAKAEQSIFLAETEGPAYGMQEIAGRLYAGHHTGLFLLENGRAKRIVETNGLWQIKALESNPKFAIGGTYSGLYLFQIKEDRSLEAIQKIEGFEESSRFFEEDHLGRIWVGQYYKGLYQLNLSAALVEVDVQKISDEYDLPIKEHILLSKIDNELYIASQAGVYKLDEATDKIIEASIFSEQLGKQPVYFLKQDRQKNIHVFAEQLVGFFKQISSKNYVYVPSSLYQLRYYLNNDLLNVAVNTNDGILFNANDGFIHYRPELENRTEVDLPLVINSVFSVTEDSTLYRRKIFDLQIDQTNALLLLPRT